MKKIILLCAAVATLVPSAAIANKLSKEQSNRLIDNAQQERLSSIADELRREWDAKKFTTQTAEGEFSMPFWDTIYGTKPEGGRSLYISLHGGGGTTPEGNDGQWDNQKQLYKPVEGLYFVPRAPTDSWNMWHQEYMDEFLRKTIAAAILFGDVNPDKVYLLGYSAGGDGLYQLAPRLADHMAAGAMMAGHPGDASAQPLRNLPFMIFMGGQDDAYERNSLAREWGTKLDLLEISDHNSYRHETHIWEDCGHWMLRRDTIAIPWMARFERVQYPQKVVWVQDDVLRPNFYWLATPQTQQQQGRKVVASIDGQVINIEHSDSPVVIVGLNDKMVDLGRPVTIIFKGKQIAKRSFKRTAPRYLNPSKYTIDAPYPVVIEITDERVTQK